MNLLFMYKPRKPLLSEGNRPLAANLTACGRTSKLRLDIFN
jgi:hypothetical protein